MKRYFTSDWHLNSILICKYAHRPFKSASRNTATLIDNCNAVASETDTVFHVGDFILIGHDRHGEFDDYGDPQLQSAEGWLKNIKSNFVLMAGNHDDGHNCESMINNMWIDLGKNYKNVFVSHFPSDHVDYRGPKHDKWGNRKKISVVLCGHVHDKWVLMYDHERNVLNVNVGVDAWDYKPVEDVEIIKLLDQMVFDRNHTNSGATFDVSWKWTSVDIEAFKRIHRFELEKRRKARLEEKYAKKGLTPEECERRRIEAMKKKGLI